MRPVVRELRYLDDGAFAQHLQRVALEDHEEKFTADANWSQVAERYRAGLGQPVASGRWTRLWLAWDGARVVGHASLMDLPGAEPEVCGGHISVERPYRGGYVAKDLNALRYAWLDHEGLALMGRCAPGNDRALAGHLRAGMTVSSYDHDGAAWLVRLPKPPEG